MLGAASAPDKTIGDYIKRKEQAYESPFIMPDGSDISGLHADVVKAIKPKLTFEQWMAKEWPNYPEGSDILKECWDAAQENV
jgi:hypothetical protein